MEQVVDHEQLVARVVSVSFIAALPQTNRPRSQTRSRISPAGTATPFPAVCHAGLLVPGHCKELTSSQPWLRPRATPARAGNQAEVL